MFGNKKNIRKKQTKIALPEPQPQKNISIVEGILEGMLKIVDARVE